MASRHLSGLTLRILAALAVILSLGGVAGRAVPAAAAGSYVVNSTADDPDAHPGDGVCATARGLCTLRAAIQEANAHPGADTITFNISGLGVKTIQLTSALPYLSDMSGVTIDGYTEPQAQPNTDPVADNAVIKVQIRGKGATSFDGIEIGSGGNLIRGLALFNLYRAIHLSGPNASNNVIAGNFIGTNAGGGAGATRCLQPTDGANGVDLYGGSSNNRIGGASPADRNVISGNADRGIDTENAPTGPTTNNNVIYGNIIGLTPDGKGSRHNCDSGIDLNSGSSYNVIGGTGVGQRNVISGNLGAGIDISHPSSVTNGLANQVVGNYIGTDLSGNAGPSYAANAYWGVNVKDGVDGTIVSNNVIGNNQRGGVNIIGMQATTGTDVSSNWIGIAPNGTPLPNGQFGVSIGYQSFDEYIGPGNVIANNPVGVTIASGSGSSGDTISRNAIYSNTVAGISVAPGTNGNVQPPVLTQISAQQASGTTCAGCTVELFLADRGAGADGQGQQYLTSTAADGTGNFSAPLNLTPGACLTATTTDTAGDTSQFATNNCAASAYARRRAVRHR